jgi:hypothetical protein
MQHPRSSQSLRRPQRRRVRCPVPVLLALLPSVVAGCGFPDYGFPPEAPGAPTDATASDTPFDRSSDGGAETGTEGAAGADSGIDGSAGAEPDTGVPDAGAEPDAPTEAAPDAPTDAAPDAPTEAAPDAPDAAGCKPGSITFEWDSNPPPAIVATGTSWSIGASTTAYGPPGAQGTIFLATIPNGYYPPNRNGPAQE